MVSVRNYGDSALITRPDKGNYGDSALITRPDKGRQRCWRFLFAGSLGGFPASLRPSRGWQGAADGMVGLSFRFGLCLDFARHERLCAPRSDAELRSHSPIGIAVTVYQLLTCPPVPARPFVCPAVERGPGDRNGPFWAPAFAGEQADDPHGQRQRPKNSSLAHLSLCSTTAV